MHLLQTRQLQNRRCLRYRAPGAARPDIQEQGNSRKTESLIPTNIRRAIMSAINTKQKFYLENRFGSRVTFRKIERKLYGHDIAAIPKMIRPFIGDTMPDAVVQPESEAELVELARWAVENNVPLTPRGKATSGYGGGPPSEKGLVVDFYRMKRIIKIDA